MYPSPVQALAKLYTRTMTKWRDQRNKVDAAQSRIVNPLFVFCLSLLGHSENNKKAVAKAVSSALALSKEADVMDALRGILKDVAEM